jgi:hypothetical protein
MDGIMGQLNAKILELITNPRIHLTIRAKECPILKIYNIPQRIVGWIATTTRGD